MLGKQSAYVLLSQGGWRAGRGWLAALCSNLMRTRDVKSGRGGLEVVTMTGRAGRSAVTDAIAVLARLIRKWLWVQR